MSTPTTTDPTDGWKSFAPVRAPASMIVSKRARSEVVESLALSGKAQVVNTLPTPSRLVLPADEQSSSTQIAQPIVPDSLTTMSLTQPSITMKVNKPLSNANSSNPWTNAVDTLMKSWQSQLFCLIVVGFLVLAYMFYRECCRTSRLTKQLQSASDMLLSKRDDYEQTNKSMSDANIDDNQIVGVYRCTNPNDSTDEVTLEVNTIDAHNHMEGILADQEGHLRTWTGILGSENSFVARFGHIGKGVEIKWNGANTMEVRDPKLVNTWIIFQRI